MSALRDDSLQEDARVLDYLAISDESLMYLILTIASPGWLARRSRADGATVFGAYFASAGSEASQRRMRRGGEAWHFN
jgi:hypothetical protein